MDKVTPIGSPGKGKRTPASRRSTHVENPPDYGEKAKQAYELLIGGKSHSEVAEILEIQHVDDVWRMLTERFKYDAAFLTDQERKSVLAMELLRLNALQAAVWPAAMLGDPKSVDSAVRIIATRAKITGLEQVDPVVNKNLVLIVGEQEQDYIAALQAASDD
jgi:hypothetical protein